LQHFGVKVQPNAGGEEKTVTLQNPLVTFEQPTLFIKNAIDEDKKSGWAVDPQFGKDHAAVFETAEELGAESGVTLTFTLEVSGNNKHNIGRPRLSVTTTPKPLTLDAGGIPARVAT